MTHQPGVYVPLRALFLVVFFSSPEPSGSQGELIVYPWSGVKFGNLGFSIGKSENSGFLETIEACDLKVGRCRHLIDFMKVCEY